jgi:hypothetical protein
MGITIRANSERLHHAETFPVCQVCNVVFAFGIGHCSAQDFISAEQEAVRNTFFSERVNRVSTIISDAASSNWGDSEKANAT